MKYLSIIGTRPQVIKYIDLGEPLIWVGQHYDKNMKDIFFSGLKIKKPTYDLGETELGKMIDAIQPILRKEKPDYVIVYGDCRSTLAGAISALYEGIRIVHIEAGCRSGNETMIEERIRVLVDKMSDIHFTPSEEAEKRLLNNYHTEVYNVGATQIDTMFETFPTKKPKNFYKYRVLTLHRDFNVDDKEKLESIIKSLSGSNLPIKFFCHPRTEAKLKNIKLPSCIKLYKPVPYKKMIQEIAWAEKVITDSGGLQVEAYFLRRPCLTLRNDTEWQETVDTGWNILVDSDTISKHINTVFRGNGDQTIYGNGNAKRKIKLILENYEKN